MGAEKRQIESLLNKVGMAFLAVDGFFQKEVTLRDGRRTILWVDQITGHGILDPEFWESQNYYLEEYRTEFSSILGKSCSQEQHAKVYKGLNTRQFQQFARHLKLGHRFLEIGSSFGGILAQVSETVVEEFWGIEPNVSDCSFLSKKIPKARIVNSGFEDSSVPSSYFDVVASFEVLEHVPDVSIFLANLSKILKIGGFVNIEVPNHRDALLCEYQNKAYEKFFYHKAHIHYFTAESLQALFTQHGFVGNVKGFQMYPFTNQVHWLLNNGPQSTAEEALKILRCNGASQMTSNKLESFIEQSCSLYNEVVENHMVSDCIVFQGYKQPIG